VEDATLEVDAREGRRLMTPWRSVGGPRYFALKTFLGSNDGDDVGEGAALAKLRTLLISEPLPTVGMFDDVTEVSEFRRGLLAVAVVVVEDGRDAGLRRMDLGCCCRCGPWESRWLSRSCSGHSDDRDAYRSSAKGVDAPPIRGRRYCRSRSMVCGCVTLRCARVDAMGCCWWLMVGRLVWCVVCLSVLSWPLQLQTREDRAGKWSRWNCLPHVGAGSR